MIRGRRTGSRPAAGQRGTGMNSPRVAEDPLWLGCYADRAEAIVGDGPPPGRPNLFGADASHLGLGVRAAYRDYDDVPPLQVSF